MLISLLRDWLLDPLALLFMLCGLCFLISAARRRGRSWLWLLPMLALLISGAPRIVNPLLANLEDRFPADTLCDTGTPIVVLGGGVDSRISTAERFEYMHTATLARVAAASRLAKVDADVPVVLAGGALQGVSEAAVMAEFLEALGLASERLLLEERSFNTASNAINVVRLLDDEQLPRSIRLVTSALHMPRAHAVFDNLGVNICAVSVDRQSLTNLPWHAVMPQTTALVKFDLWMHERIALITYRIQGFI